MNAWSTWKLVDRVAENFWSSPWSFTRVPEIVVSEIETVVFSAILPSWTVVTNSE